MTIRHFQSSYEGTTDLDKGVIQCPLGAFTKEDGDALAKFASGANAFPGLSQESNKELVMRWNNEGTPTAAIITVAVPEDMDSGSAITVHWLADMSGSTDTPFIVHEVYFGKADTDAAGTDDEIDGGTTVTEYQSPVASADVQGSPNSITLLFAPEAGEVGTDDTIIRAVWIEYVRSQRIDQRTLTCCRIIVPVAHKLVTAKVYFQNITQTGTLVVSLKQTDVGDARGGTLVGTALDNTTTGSPITNLNHQIEFTLDNDDKGVAPARRMYFLQLTGTDPADRLSEPSLLLEVNDELS